MTSPAPGVPGEDLGRLVRETWVAWAKEQPDPKPSWLTGWDGLDAGQREVDVRIGAAVAAAERERIKAARAVSACCGAEYHREPGKYGRWECYACGQQCDLIGKIA